MTDYFEASALEGDRKVENYNRMKACGHGVPLPRANLKKVADEYKGLMEALARITKLEKRVAELEARPSSSPYVPLQPYYPIPGNPTYPWIITGTGLPDSIKPKVYK